MPTKKNNLKEMDNYIELYNLPRLNQGEKNKSQTNNEEGD